MAEWLKATIREESEQHVVHRLEAFSDIVIGFSLAMVTLDLVLPRHSAIELFTTNPLPLLGFVVTFLFVSVFWWSTHRLFTYYFVPIPVNVVLVFAALGGILFFNYSLQVVLHGRMSDPVALSMYTGTIGFVFAIIGVLTWQGVRLRGERMSPEVLFRGRRRALTTVLIGLVLIPAAVMGGFTGFQGGARFLTFGIFAAVVIGRLAVRRPRPIRPSV